MATLNKRLAALEKQRKLANADDGYREESFLRDGKPWVRYSYPGCAIELPCNGRDDPLQAIGQRVEAGEEKPDGLTEDESSAWDVAAMEKVGTAMIQRIKAGEIRPEDLTPHERECWELVTAVREKF